MPQGRPAFQLHQRLAQAWLIRTMIVLVVVALICLWLGLNSVLSLSAPHYYYAF